MAKREQKEYKVRAYNLDYKPGETDLEYYHRLAKVADQRLVRLEEMAGMREGKAGTPGMEKVTAYAYDRAMRDLEIYGGGKRFNTKPPLNPDGTVDNRLLSEKLADIRTFLSSVTSTKQGVQQVYQERANTINDKFGTNFTWTDLADYFRSGDANTKLKGKVINSDLLLRAIGVIQRADEEVVKDIKKNKDKVTKSTDKMVYKKALELMKTPDSLKGSVLKGVSKERRALIEAKIKEFEEEGFNT